MWMNTIKLLFNARGGGGLERNLPRAWRHHRREHWLRDARGNIPLGEYGAELRLRRLRLVRNDNLTRSQLRALRDPDLPVDILLDKSQRAAAFAVHLRDSEIKPVLHVRAHGLIWILEKEVGERWGEVQILHHFLQHGIDLRRRSLGRVKGRGRIEQGYRLAIIPEPPVTEVAAIFNVQPPRTLRRDFLRGRI